jgi:hypothetical protein
MTLQQWVDKTPGALTRLQERTGFAYTTISNIVHGHTRNPNRDTVVKISKATGGVVSVDAIFDACGVST